MHAIASFVFWASLALYGITLATVSYVGVYLTYIAIPIILLSGVLALLTKPSTSGISLDPKTGNKLNQAAASGLQGATKIIAEVNTSLDVFNRTFEMTREQTKNHQAKLRELRLQRIEPCVNLKHTTSHEEQLSYRKVIQKIDDQILAIETEIREIEHACKAEAEKLVSKAG